MATGSANSHATKPKTVSKKVFTKQQKQKLILRFEKEMAQKEHDFRSAVDREIKLLRLKFNNRLNKILRKFWDVKLEDILDVEREISSKTPLTLFYVLKQLEKLKSDSTVESGPITDTPIPN